MGTLAMSLRMIPLQLPTFEELGLPPAVEYFANLPQGLVLVTGPTGSGKSTTLGVDHRLHQRRTAQCHILTIEDPIEYVHTHKRSAVNQREVGNDTHSFARALRAALREDPDVILVGEMRDPETMQFALSIAETGHLVFATLHTNDAPQALDRIVRHVPGRAPEPDPRAARRVRSRASSSQRLVPRIGGGMVAAFEVLIANNPVRNLVREGKTHQIRNVLATEPARGHVHAREVRSTTSSSRADHLRGRARPLACTPRRSARRRWRPRRPHRLTRPRRTRLQRRRSRAGRCRPRKSPGRPGPLRRSVRRAVGSAAGGCYLPAPDFWPLKPIRAA